MAARGHDFYLSARESYQGEIKTIILIFSVPNLTFHRESHQ